MSMTILAAALMNASTIFSLPPGLLSAVCYVESAHDPQKVNRNDKGSPSIGECQIKLETARMLGYSGTAELLRTDANVNIHYSAKYLSYQLSRYHDIRKAIGAYNSGSYRPGRNARYINKVLNAWRKRL